MNSLPISHHLCAPADDESFGGESSGKFAEARQSIARTARSAGQQIKSAASDTASRAKETVEHIATEKKDQTASRIGGYSSAIHESARSLEEQDPNIAWFTHQVADRLQRVADHVRTNDFGGLRRDVEDLARRHPAAFFGGMFAFGLLAGNLMKARRQGADDSSADEPDGETDWNNPPVTDPLQTPQPESGAPMSTPPLGTSGF